MAAEGEGPEQAGVAHINRHGQEHFGGVLKCTWTENKGRIVCATRSFQPGEVILVESPLHIVREEERCPAFKKLKKLCKDQEDDFDYEPLWYWCALQSLTPEQLEGSQKLGCTGATEEVQHNLLLLHHEEVTEPSTAAEILAREIAPAADPITIERLIQIWVLNCFEFSEKPQGYSTYFFSSFMSHSCFPNAVWHYSGDDHVLRSRREIRPGDEVCISYLPESGLLQSAPSRRMELNETKRFWCDCERCIPGVADLSRGLLCPKCGEGEVFAKTPAAGPAKDNSLLPIHFVGSECTGCGHAVTQAESKKLGALEQQLQDLVDKYTKDLDGRVSKATAVTIKQLQADEAFIDKHFCQHVLADLAWEQFGSHYAAKHRVADQRRLLERRCEFHKAAYPGLSGAHAWALEALGDCMRTSGRTAAAAAEQQQEAQPQDGTGQAKKLKRGAWQAVAQKDSEAAKGYYNDALRVLRLMFGSEHEYATEVEKKLASLATSQ